MNYKTNIPVYQNGKLENQLTMMFDDNQYEQIEQLSVDYNLSMNMVIRTLLDHALKHCNIDIQVDDGCYNCQSYISDDQERYVCVDERSKHYCCFRPKNAWCVFHKRV